MKNNFLNSKGLQKIIYNLWNSLQGPLEESLSDEVINRARLIGINDAIRNIHFPLSVDKLRLAEFRLKFEELFYLQLHILRYTQLRSRKLGGFVFKHIGDYFNSSTMTSYPFELTKTKRVIR